MCDKCHLCSCFILQRLHFHHSNSQVKLVGIDKIRLHKSLTVKTFKVASKLHFERCSTTHFFSPILLATDNQFGRPSQELKHQGNSLKARQGAGGEGGTMGDSLIGLSKFLSDFPIGPGLNDLILYVNSRKKYLLRNLETVSVKRRSIYLVKMSKFETDFQCLPNKLYYFVSR